jgi:hypothetical protein
MGAEKFALGAAPPRCDFLRLLGSLSTLETSLSGIRLRWRLFQNFIAWRHPAKARSVPIVFHLLVPPLEAGSKSFCKKEDVHSLKQVRCMVQFHAKRTVETSFEREVAWSLPLVVQNRRLASPPFQRRLSPAHIWVTFFWRVSDTYLFPLLLTACR